MTLYLVRKKPFGDRRLVSCRSPQAMLCPVPAGRSRSSRDTALLWRHQVSHPHQGAEEPIVDNNPDGERPTSHYHVVVLQHPKGGFAEVGLTAIIAAVAVPRQ